MTIQELQIVLGKRKEVQAIRKTLETQGEKALLLNGLYASLRASLLMAIDRPMLIVMSTADDALYMQADLKALGANALLFPVSHRRRQGNVDEAMMVQRTEVLTSLPQPLSPKGERGDLLIVTYPEALEEAVPAPEQMAGQSLTIQRGEQVQIATLTEMLTELGFERVDFVYQPGQYAVRGGIVDVYSYSHDDPYRLDFFGDEVDSIRTFDIEDQLSKEKVEKASLTKPLSPVPLSSTGARGEDMASATLVDYLGEGWMRVEQEIGGLRIEPLSPIPSPPKGKGVITSEGIIRMDSKPQPCFHKQFDLLLSDLREKQAAGYQIYICSDQKKQLDRLQSILTSMEQEQTSVEQEQTSLSPLGERVSGTDGREAITFTPVLGALHEGFVDEGQKVVVYTDHQIFERYHRVTQQSENARRGKAIVTLREINQLQIGDYVVHSDHGIGQFGGLVTTSVNGKPQEMVKITFRDGDFIFVSIHNLHRISKYKGKEGTAPTISRLGSGAWERLKERTKDKVKEIARDLIRLYATRKQQPGHQYARDGYMQHELEASFLYEDTPDQAKATADVKHDMESPRPMDRLICGDVGFGKTEIAMRAAFKAATDGKQVAVLVPTTVLALQHYNTFRERFRDFPVRIEYLSRTKTAKETKEILEALKEGKVDILVGTHKLVSKTVVWKDLGLLIIDEEQKFGVAVKEKLKSLRTNIDVLTLTATPIPRTLQFSLLGARDLSVMTTPPPNRYPVQTELITIDDEDIIKEAIDLEMSRNGQIFVVNNRIDMLDRIEDRLHRLCPEARIVKAHGQMAGEEMEKRIEDFINYEYDILLATTIIESGIDIPNVNTIIIFSANHYGLSDLHQLRGRVGRSNRKAYCYLIAPEKDLLTADARRRLESLEVFSELGSGFNLAMQDLDIRGAGNMLGSEQSGFIADLGYETYQRILNEAIKEIKEEASLLSEESDTLSPEGERDNMPDEAYNWVEDCQLETDLNICFPNTYIENISERITLYRELDSLHSEQQLVDFQRRLEDRFGKMPGEALELMHVVRLRRLCCQLGIEKVFLKSERMVIYLPQKNERYYQSKTFERIIRYAISRADRCAMKEEVDKKGQKTGKRYVTILQVRTIEGAINLLSKI